MTKLLIMDAVLCPSLMDPAERKKAEIKPVEKENETRQGMSPASSI
jgi:hypothetical protein